MLKLLFLCTCTGGIKNQAIKLPRTAPTGATTGRYGYDPVPAAIHHTVFPHMPHFYSNLSHIRKSIIAARNLDSQSISLLSTLLCAELFFPAFGFTVHAPSHFSGGHSFGGSSKKQQPSKDLHQLFMI